MFVKSFQVRCSHDDVEDPNVVFQMLDDSDPSSPVLIGIVTHSQNSFSPWELTFSNSVFPEIDEYKSRFCFSYEEGLDILGKAYVKFKAEVPEE